MSSEAIKVGVRLRPLVSHEKGQQPCLSINGSDVSVIQGTVPDGQGKEGHWRFDHAMDSSDSSNPNNADNVYVYDTLGRSIVEHVLQGFNACLFCYGQTGTGKTATIFGDKNSGPGFLILLLRDLFKHKTLEENQGNSVNIAVEMLEIYNEKVFDLLHETQSHIELHVLPSGVQIKGAKLEIVNSVDECLTLIHQGDHRKHTAATAMNSHSSRGHTIIKLVIQRLQNDEGIHLSSEIYLADLAGHENEKTTKVTGERLIELSYINKSLMWLESALHALATRHEHHAHHGQHGHARHMHDMSLFRNSKLTLMLSNALLGNSLAHVIVTLSPAAAHFGTSLSSLRFGNEVKRIVVEVHSSAHVDPSIQVKHLEAEVKQLKEQLAMGPSGALEAEVKRLKAELAMAISRPSAALEAEVKHLKESHAEATSALSAAWEAEVKQLKEQLAMATSTPSTTSRSSVALEAEMKELKHQLATVISESDAFEAEVKHLKEQLAMNTSRPSAALDAQVKQLKEQLGMATSGPSSALEAEVAQLRKQLALSSSRRSAANRSSGALSKTSTGAAGGTAAAESTLNQDQDVQVPTSDFIGQLTSMSPEVVLEKLEIYKAEKEELCRQLEALVAPRTHPKLRRTETSPVFPNTWPLLSPSEIAAPAASSPAWPRTMPLSANPQTTRINSPSRVAPVSPLCSTSPQRMTESVNTYAAGSASTYAPGSSTPSSPVRPPSPHSVAQSAGTYSSRVSFGARRGASPRIADVSPMSMRSTLRTHRAASPQSPHIGAPSTVTRHYSQGLQLSGGASPSYGGASPSYGGSLRI